MNGHLERIREKKALSRKDLASRSHVNASTIYRAEHGKTKLRPSTIRKLAQALGIEPEELTSEQGTLGF
jgi:transcriptional regulator with XRE-family HTH domain